MNILAIDLGKFNSVCCLFRTENRKARFHTVATNRDEIVRLFKSCKADLVVMEACGPSGWIHDVAQAYGLKTLVCSTNEEAWRWANVKRKTDKDDALKLARMATMQELKPVHMPSHQHREFRSLVKYRKTLDRRINKTKNAIRARFVNHGITIDKGDKAWHTGRKLINSFRKPIAQCAHNELWRGELDMELTILDSLCEQLNTIVKKLESLGKEDARIQRIMTIPGVGPRTAEILVACIDDPNRFTTGRQVSAYFGLVPRQYQSGETDRNGRITKRGNPLARTILVECAWASMRYNSWAKGVYERICGKQKTRKKKAAIALARKLAVIAWAMLRDKTDWSPKKMVDVTQSYGRIQPSVMETLVNMKPKENADQRKSRLRKEARAAKQAAATETAPNRSSAKKASSPARTPQPKNSPTPLKSAKTTPIKQPRSKPKPANNPKAAQPQAKRSRKPVPAV